MARTNKDKIAKLQAEIKALKEQEEREEKGVELFRLLLNAPDSERHMRALGDNLQSFRDGAQRLVSTAMDVEKVLKKNRERAKKIGTDSTSQSEYQPTYEQEQTQQY